MIGFEVTFDDISLRAGGGQENEYADFHPDKYVGSSVAGLILNEGFDVYEDKTPGLPDGQSVGIEPDGSLVVINFQPPSENAIKTEVLAQDRAGRLSMKFEDDGELEIRLLAARNLHSLEAFPIVGRRGLASLQTPTDKGSRVSTISFWAPLWIGPSASNEERWKQFDEDKSMLGRKSLRTKHAAYMTNLLRAIRRADNVFPAPNSSAGAA